MYNMSGISELITSTSWFFQYGPKIREGSAASSAAAEDAGVGKEEDCAVAVKVTFSLNHSVKFVAGIEVLALGAQKPCWTL